MLKDTEQGSEETGKIVEIASGVMWEVLNPGLRESLLQHLGSDCIFISEER